MTWTRDKVKKPKGSDPPDPVIRRPDHRFDWDWIWKYHQEYWQPERVASRTRFAEAVKPNGFMTGLTIVCDGQIDGSDCGNVIGYAPLPDSHDGLCARCRRNGVPFPPRKTMTPDGVYAMGATGPEIVPRPWSFPNEDPDRSSYVHGQPPKPIPGFTTPGQVLGQEEVPF